MPAAILSVSDKSGLVDFAAGLVELGWSLLASGGTARALRAAGLEARDVAEYSGSPEILGGRVKTLHPAVHGGLLARPGLADRQELQGLGWDLIDLAVVNLYPFETTLARPNVTDDEIIENIDIGGVALVRAAAKNYDRTGVVCDPADYPLILEELRQGELSEATRLRLARKGFLLTARYDAAIAAYFSRDLDEDAGRPLDEPLGLMLHPAMQLRYGENPHQPAMLYSFRPGDGPLGGKVLHGKALSYNNLLDLDAAWRAAISYTEPAVGIVKHLSPCGLAEAANLEQALQLARASDPVSAFGGVIAANRPFDFFTAGALGDLFVECIAAPGFETEALEILSRRKNLRLVDMSGVPLAPRYDLRSVNLGVLRQAIDQGDPAGAEWRSVGRRPATEAELAALRFAWTACRHVKSNAIVFARAEPAGCATVGIGGGQPNRVDCVRIAAQRAGGRAQGAVMASDAFFPFPDSIEEAARAGVTAVISPGGSVRDEEAIAAADDHGLAMIFTGVRHFRH
ncbi:MAG: bifunctional phosphoribosylaminoimidazolecarboxamide formyltransferase/IMP cyclohydrolase [Chloroflexota bacterium]